MQGNEKSTVPRIARKIIRGARHFALKPLIMRKIAQRARYLALKLGPTLQGENRSFIHLEPIVSKAIHPKDSLYSVYQDKHCPEEYFVSGLYQLYTIDALLKKHVKRRLTDCQSILDYACHYGRTLRCLRAALPQATLYACDIDQAAVNFCVQEFNCTPCLVDWNSAENENCGKNDLVMSISLVTHTNKDFFSRVLNAWELMMRPGGLLLFTYLSERYIDEWLAGRMEYYGKWDFDPATYAAIKQQKASEFWKIGYTFLGCQTSYSNTDEYGIGFMSTETVVREIGKHTTLEFLESLSGSSFRNSFGQDLVVVRKRPQ